MRARLRSGEDQEASRRRNGVHLEELGGKLSVCEERSLVEIGNFRVFGAAVCMKWDGCMREER